MSFFNLNESSTEDEVINFLEKNDFPFLINEFAENQIDGSDFFELELRDINGFIPVFKQRKRFLKLWSSVTGKKFDINGVKIPAVAESCSLTQKNLTTGDMQSTTTESQPFSIRQDLTNISSSSITNSDIHNDELRLEITSTAGTYSSSKDSTNASCRPISNQSFASELELQSTSTQQPQAISVTAKDISALATTSSSQAIVRCATGSWIKNFKIPARWEPSIEKALSDGKLTPEQKSALNRQLCMSIIAQSTDTVTASERNQIALMLVQKYPCLSGSIGSGHQFWANKIKDRLLNITRKSSRENKKMIESTGQQYQKAKPGRKRKSDEALNLPEMPEGETDETIQEHLTSLQAFCKTGKQDVLLVRQLMDVTFPKRRRDIIENKERVWKVVKDYPPLTKGKGNEVKAELGRILRNKNLPQEMKERFDINRARLIAAVKRSKTKEVQALAILLDESDSSQITEMENRMLMAALPFALGEKRTSTLSPGDLFWKRVDDETGDMSISQLVEESTTPRLLSSGTALEVSSLCLAAEGMVICKFSPANHILNAVVTLLACFYSFNMSYPNGLSRNVYSFLEYILLGIKPSKVQIGLDQFISDIESI